ncbi:MAG: (Fe-S)-binding protein [Chloroflexota bacterium]
MTTLSFWNEEQMDFSFAAQVTPDIEKLRTCIQCGSCTASCPTANLMDLSPRQLWGLIRLGLKHEVFQSKTFWLCTTCQACTAHCPRGIPLSDTMIGLKTYAVREGIQIPPGISLLRDTVKTVYNISGDQNEERLAWSENLPQQLTGIEGKTGADILYFVGCIASFYPRVHSIPQSFGRVLNHAGISFTTMGSLEWCCGYPLYNAGMKAEMANLVEHNLAQVEELGVTRLVATCPSCYYTWKHLYPQFASLPPNLTIMHATQFLAELLDSRRIRPSIVPRVVTYHDPCDLGRKSEEYDAPRYILESLPGVELREMANMRDNAMCCGGGGDVEIFSDEATMNVAIRRLQQALDVEADAIISACQQCKRTLLNAAQRMRHRVKVLDVTELIWEAMQDQMEW